MTTPSPGRLLVLSDIHANLEALEAVLADVDRAAYDSLLVLGDLVGYGADPGAVIDRIVALAPLAIIRGNHDKVCAGLEPADTFNELARWSITWTAAQLTPQQMQYVTDLPKGPQLVTPELEICHGAPFDEDYYIFEGSDALRAMNSASARICLFGHTHLPGVFARRGDDEPGPPSPEGDLQLPVRSRTLINVGSVGQPRDGDPRAAYGIVDLGRNMLSLRRVEYDIEAAQEKIRRAHLPERLAARLATGT